jgi:lactoylglutathione lyase
VIQINVNDMDKAIDFYCVKLGFQIRSREHYPQIVVLDNEPIPLILFKVTKEAAIDYGNAAQTLINIATENLVNTLEGLRAKGVTVIHETPERCPVGIYAAVRDPSGNVVELLEYKT